jgi:hypothetical protein
VTGLFHYALILDALWPRTYNDEFAAMFNRPGESSRNPSSAFGPAAVIMAAVLFIFTIAARPLEGKATHSSLMAVQTVSRENAVANPSRTGISGQIVDSGTHAPISGGEVIVALEQRDGTGTDVVFTQTNADSSGHFSFDRLPLATTFDLVTVAINGSGVAYDATIVVGVPAGTDLGAIPLVAERGDSSGPAKIEGIITATSGSRPASIRAKVSAIQTVTIRGGLAIPGEVPQTVTVSGADFRPITIPAESGNAADILLRSNSECPADAPANANCGHYILVVPGSNPSVGLFNGGKLSYEPPAAGPVLYSVRAGSFMPFGAGASVCIPSFQAVNADAAGQSLTVFPGRSVTAQQIDFSGCW